MVHTFCFCMRRCRHTFVDKLVPFDDSISFHMMVAVIGAPWPLCTPYAT